MGYWKQRIKGSAKEGGTIGMFMCSNCNREFTAFQLPLDEENGMAPPPYCPCCGEHNVGEDESITILQVIRHNLLVLEEQYNECNELPDDEKYSYWEDEYGGSLLYGIDCHVVFQGEPPCLVEERGLEMYPDNQKERWKRDDACAECKAIWLMRKYE